MGAAPLASFVLESTPARNLPLMLCGLAGLMYWHGGRRYRVALRLGMIAPARRRTERWRAVCFALGLIVLVLALQEPVDAVADKRFWAHMSQHVLLLTVVPPLILLGAPWMRLWRAFPLSFRRPVARWAVHSPGGAPLRVLARVLGNPWVAWTLLAIDVIAWHIPAAYDLTLRSEAVHYAEHASFLIFALLAWGQLIDSPPFRSRLDEWRRVAFALGQMVVGWVLAMLLAFAQHPWYTPYVISGHRLGGLSPLDDQQLAAAVMWVPASFPWSALCLQQIYRWISRTHHEKERPETVAVTIEPPLGPWPTPPGLATEDGSPAAAGMRTVPTTDRRIHV